MSETVCRSLLKTITYRLFSLAVIFVLFYVILADSKGALINSLWVEIVKIIQYYVFERIWARIGYGKLKL